MQEWLQLAAGGLTGFGCDSEEAAVSGPKLQSTYRLRSPQGGITVIMQRVDAIMRYDAEHKERTRERVLAEAARALKVDGPHKLGVAEVMKAAGLTHGGFYVHFPSKDALVSEAIETAFADSRRLYDQAAGDRSPREALAAWINAYVSEGHRDRPERGCVLPALSAELPRMSEDARRRYAEGLRRMTARIQSLLDRAGVSDAEALAPSMVAEMVGAVALARAVPDAAQSASILQSSRSALLERAGVDDSS